MTSPYFSVVSTAGLDLSSDAGRAELDHRLVTAAYEVCGTPSDIDLVGTNQARACRADVLVTVEVTAVAMLVGIVLGTLLAVMRLSDNPLLRWVAGGYVGLFRGTPILIAAAR